MYCDVFGGSSVWEYFFTWPWNRISMCAYILGVLRDWMDMIFAKVRIMEISIFAELMNLLFQKMRRE